MKDFIDYSIIWKYIYSELSREEKDELNRWLEANPRHRLYFEKVVANNGDNTSTDLAKSTKLQEIKNTYQSKSRVFKRRAFFIGKVAALIVIILITGYGIFIFNKNNKKELQLTEINFDPGMQKAVLVLNNGEKLELEAWKDTLLQQQEAEIRNTASKLQYKTVSGKKLIATHQEIEYNTLLVPRGGEYTLILSDETRVHLNSESMLKFPVNFTGDVREVYLKGEAYFDVKTDPTRPFIVNTGSIVTKVFGTSFNISSYPEKDLITTTLAEGNVTVLKAGENNTGWNCYLVSKVIFQSQPEQFRSKPSISVNIQPGKTAVLFSETKPCRK